MAGAAVPSVEYDHAFEAAGEVRRLVQLQRGKVYQFALTLAITLQVTGWYHEVWYWLNIISRSCL